jgi:hypothetical protein
MVIKKTLTKHPNERNNDQINLPSRPLFSFTVITNDLYFILSSYTISSFSELERYKLTFSSTDAVDAVDILQAENQKVGTDGEWEGGEKCGRG